MASSRTELSRKEIEKLFCLISLNYYQEDDYEGITVVFHSWPSVKNKNYKKLKDFLDLVDEESI